MSTVAATLTLAVATVASAQPSSNIASPDKGHVPVVRRTTWTTWQSGCLNPRAQGGPWGRECAGNTVPGSAVPPRACGIHSRWVLYGRGYAGRWARGPSVHLSPLPAIDAGGR